VTFERASVDANAPHKARGLQENFEPIPFETGHANFSFLSETGTSEGLRLDRAEKPRAKNARSKTGKNVFCSEFLKR
jgi:hypothetical protein